MKRWLCLLLVLLPLLCAAEEGSWLIKDSGTRLLTEKELLKWDYESLGYILNEIYARHGYHFDEGSDYANYFAQQGWYVPHPQGNFDGCFMELTDLEWQNVDLIEQVRMAFFLQGSMNPEGHSLWSDEPSETPIDFQRYELARGKSYNVYSAPSSKSWRGAKGKASVSTNGPVWIAGWVDNWLLIYYETSKGSVRAGYINGDKISGSVPVDTRLEFTSIPAKITQKCTLTDDVVLGKTAITTLKAGKEVTYLAPYYADQDWAYIETKYDSKVIRAFVPLDCIEVID